MGVLASGAGRGQEEGLEVEGQRLSLVIVLL